MKSLTRFAAVCLLSLTTAPLRSAEVIINEIMYHAAPGVPEDTRREWIELYNAGTNVVNLSGWRFDKGIEYSFATNTVLQPGGYLVIAANQAAFQSDYPGVNNVVGNWLGQLSNTGEEIRLVDARGETVNTLRYADAGEWAVRQRIPDPARNLPSWDWLAVTDGFGPALEVINPALPNSSAQNWTPSLGAGGTPGAANSTSASNIPPLILGTSHLPAVPKSTDTVTISARLVDELPGGFTASLFYRNASSTSPPGFISAPMFDDGTHNDGLAGDGLFAAVLPAQTNGTVVEFYVQSSDGPNTRTWPAPALVDGSFVQAANALYQVDDSVYAGGQPILRLVMTGIERLRLQTNSSNSDAQQNITLVSMDGVETQIRYGSDIRIRGAGSRGRPTKNYRVNIPSDRPWNGLTAINLNSQYPHSQMVGAVAAQKAGLPAANARFVQVRVNGLNLARSGPPVGGDGASWGTYVLVEPINNEWAERHFPTDGNGNVYRASTGNHNADLSSGTTRQYYINRGYSKTSNSSEDDWNDLMALTAAVSSPPDGNYANAVRLEANVELWMRYFAVFTLLTSMETSLGTGRGDDYALYRGVVDPRFMIIGHDFDTILGQGDTPGPVGASIFRMVPAANAAAPGHPASNVQNLNSFMWHPDLVPIYFSELKRIGESVLSAQSLDPIIDQFLSDVVTEQTKSSMKAFAASRVANVLNQIPQTIRITNSLPLLNGYPLTTVPTVALTGSANAIHTRTVRVNGLPANWIAYQGAWSIGVVPLNPGLNRVLVQSFDAQGAEFERATTDIWYDDGSVQNVGGPIVGNSSWTAAGGPYRLTSSITVPSGATLTIEPGATVYLGSGMNLTVANGGRLLAEGAGTARIRFTREPGSAGNWGGITINGGAGSPETRIAYAHLEFNGSTAIHSSDGTVFLDHLTFGSTDRQYVSLDRSSFVVSDCLFPAITAGFEPVHGSGGIKAGGRGLFLRNFWGKVVGYNDALDFTGGNRPGPILQVINNVFAGSDDDLLDLDSTDAWVEGNIFLHTHRNGSPDSASAISGGADNPDTSQITAVGNLFFDVDHAANAKQGNFYTLLNNTIVHQTKIGSQDTSTAVVILADDGTAEGAGMYLEGNIIYDAENLTRNVTTARVTYTNNLISQLQGVPWSGPGGNNVNADPSLQRIPPFSETTNFSSWAAAQVMWDYFSLKTGSPASGTGPNGRDKGGVIPLGASISGEPTGTTPFNTAVLRVAANLTGSGIPAAGFPDGSGFTHYRWRLDGGTWSAETPTSTPITLNGLGSGPHYVEVAGKRDSGFYQDDAVYGADAVVTRSRTWTVDGSFTQVRLNEVLARNDSAFAHEGTFPDAVEFYNAGGATVNLAGWGVTDDPAAKFKFAFPANSMIAPGQFLVVYADDLATSGLHLSFGLDQAGDALYFYNAGGALMDSVQFGIQLPDLSIGRAADGRWTLCAPTMGTANTVQPLGDSRALRINEWLANGRTLYPDDFIEIYNPSPAAVLLGGLHLTDEPLGWPGRHQIPSLTFMAAGAHFVFLADGNAGAGANHVDFKLSANQGAIGLFDAATNLIDCIFYGPQITDSSEGRRPSGSSAIAKFNVPTPGGPNPGVSGSTTISNFVVNVFGVTDKPWRYDNAGIDRGSGWRASTYNDSAWPTGFGMFGFETTPGIYPHPIQTFIPSPDQGGNNTVYYRTHFQWTNGAGYFLVATSYVDDGAVFYLNGSEAGRIRINANPVVYSTPAENASEPALDVVNLLSTSLVNGDNVLAVEVHQPGGGSSDDLFGMSLSAVKSVTNVTVFGVVLNEVMVRNRSFTNAGGTNLADWIELYNPSTNAFDLSGMSLSDTLEEPQRLWFFPPGVTLAAGSHLTVRFDGDSPATTDVGPVLNTGFGLGGEGDAVYLYDTVARTNALLDSVVFGLQVPDYSIGRVPNALGEWALTLPTPSTANIAAALGNRGNLKINEWLANPSGNDDDFFELYNPNPQPVDLSGLYLSDSLTNRTQSPIQDLSFIGTGDDAFVQFIADGNTASGADHVSFNLRGAGESVALFSVAEALIDAYTFNAQENGVSEGRFPDGSTNVVRFRGTTTPGRSNLLPLEAIAISELLTHTDLPFEDAIELQNTSASALDISGWYLSDRGNDPKRFRIPNGTVLDAGGFVVFYESQFNPDFSGRPPYFALSSSEGEELFLSTADAAGNLTGFRTSVKFGAGENGVSFGRHPTSIGFDFTAMSQRTFGADLPANVEQFRTGTGLSNAYPRVGPVVINEIMYHPPDIISGGMTNDNDRDEFIELRNNSAAEVPLFHPNHPTNTWRLRDAIDFNFPTGVSLPAGAYLLVVGFDPATNTTALSTFRSRYGISPSVPIYGPWQGRLANDEENVELYKPDAPQAAGLPDGGFVPYIEVDKVKYADTSPWPTLADGNTNGVGMSLQRRVASEYGNDPINWIAGVPTPGAASGPGGASPPSITSLTSPHDVQPGANDSLMVTASGAATLTYQWRFNGVVIPGATSATLFLNNFQAGHAGVYSVIVVNGAGAASASTRVNLRSGPVIVRQPQDLIAAVGGTAVFSVVAEGTPPLGYQWRKNEADLAGANSATLVLRGLQTNDIANYRVVITNVYGSVTSSAASLALNTPPTIVAHPEGTNVFVGATVTLRVAAIGSAPLRYQWRFNGLNLVGATDSTLTLTDVQLTNAGNYSVRVTNAVDSVLSAVATVNVAVRPTVTVTATDSSASETGENPGEFTLARTGSIALPLQVNVTIAGNAMPGSDYLMSAGPITIPVGANSTTVAVTVLDDTVREGNETVILALAGGLNYIVGSPASATVTLIDNDNVAPSVTLTNPVDGFVVTFPATIVLGAAASDPDGTIAKVEFFDNGTNRLGQSTSAPYAFIWANAAAGSHVLTAVATDNLGSTGASAPVSVVVNSPPTVVLISPSDGAILNPGSDITLVASVLDNDGTVALVEFLEGTNLLGSDNTIPYSLVWPGAPEATYTLTARATDDRGAVSISTPVVVTVGIPEPAFGDRFANRGVITGFANVAFGTNVLFTREPGEPRHASRNGNHSGWINWTAPASGLCTMDTFGSNFDTLLAVYTGSVVSNLTAIASNDDANDNTTESRVTFSAVAGTTYQIAVDGYGTNGTVVMGNVGRVVFRLNLPNPFPIITTQPQSQMVDQGADVIFTVTTAGPGPQTFRWRFNGANLSGQTSTNLVRNNVQANNQGTYTFVVSNPSGSVTSAPATLVVRTAPAITTQPGNVAVAPGTTVVFIVRATGSAPLSYQWRYNGAIIPGATSSNHVAATVEGRDEGAYSVVVSNFLGSVVSREAILTVNDGLVTNSIVPLLFLTNTWRFQASGEDLGIDWRFPGFDDSAWPTGSALFGFETTPEIYPFPFVTPLGLNTSNGVPIQTYYLRTTFSLGNIDNPSGLIVIAYVDDGAVWYVNGREAARLRISNNLPLDGVTNGVVAQNVGTEGQAASVFLPATNVVAGENLLAVELHQGNLPSSDVVFGMTLDSLTAITNRPVMLLPELLPGGDTRLTLLGISGRNYAIDASTNLVNWTTLVTYTNFITPAQFLHPPANPPENRFYRGRLVR